VRQVGVTLVEIGHIMETAPWELDAAINEKTAAIVYFAGSHLNRNTLPLEFVVERAHARGVPVIVDAAAQIPPIANLWRFTRELGADVVAFSGGKGLRGPQPSGLVFGRKEIIAGCRANGSPNQSIGRPMKVGKEELLGILAAVEWSLAQDEPALLAAYEETVRGWVEGLSDIPGVTAERRYPSEAGQPHSRAIVRFAAPCPLTRDQVMESLWQQDPRIAVAAVGGDAIALNPQTLEPGEADLVLAALRKVLQAGTPIPVIARA
jgi:seryl-tRNA(Sec) selenium transferase